MTDVERVINIREKEVEQANEKMEDFNIELRQIEQQKLAFRKEMDLTETELRQKLAVVDE